MKQLSIFDISERKHGGNPRSIEARARTNITGRRKQVLDYVTSRGVEGATSHEISKALGLPMHAISGRLSELKALGKVRVSGVRNGADVLVAVIQTRGVWRYDTE